jgi:twitching motility two-component system response regulator PilG
MGGIERVRQSLMVIDDALVVRTILDICLHRAGYEVTCFEDGLQALSWLNTAGAHIPDLIFVDLGLPRLDGYEIIRLLKVKPQLKDTVLVILSGRDGLLDRIKGRLVGAHAYLTKPFRTQTIVEVVQMYLGGADVCRTIEPLHPNRLAVPVRNQKEDQRAERGMRPC